MQQPKFVHSESQNCQHILIIKVFKQFAVRSSFTHKLK